MDNGREAVRVLRDSYTDEEKLRIISLYIGINVTKKEPYESVTERQQR